MVSSGEMLGDKAGNKDRARVKGYLCPAEEFEFYHINSETFIKWY